VQRYLACEGLALESKRILARYSSDDRFGVHGARLLAHPLAVDEEQVGD
jgi:hypothetical protein